jgi:nucleoid-associated protein YgaU
MNRETKIGLLVGLAFIIVIGILLSDHIQSSTEPPRAALSTAADNVQQAVNTPGAPSRSVVITPPQEVVPQNPVPTAEELERPRNAEAIVRIVETPAERPTQVVIAPEPQPVRPQPQPAHEIRQDHVAEIEAGADGPGGIELIEAARRKGEELVLVSEARPAGMKQYKAQPGDTLNKMAARLMGANTKANRDAIIAANPSLKDDPNKIIAGRTYLIPASGAATPVIVEKPQPTPSNGPEYIYTVKAGDSLWKIAEQQLGDGAAWAAIKELNKDVLKGGDTVIEGMKLRLPAKPIASVE